MVYNLREAEIQRHSWAMQRYAERIWGRQADKSEFPYRFSWGRCRVGRDTPDDRAPNAR